MRSAVLVLAVAVVACTETYDSSTQVEYTPDSCIACHSGTLVHPEAKFPLLMSDGSLHDNMNCQDCHKFDAGPGLLGYHADCEACHFENQTGGICTTYPQAMGMPCPAIDPLHTGVTGYAWDSVHRDFCVGCHSNGM
jgi:hypothetical protein